MQSSPETLVITTAPVTFRRGAQVRGAGVGPERHAKRPRRRDAAIAAGGLAVGDAGRAAGPAPSVAGACP